MNAEKNNIKNICTKLTLTHSLSLLHHVRRPIFFGSPTPDLPTSLLHPTHASALSSVRGRDRGRRSVEDAWNAVPGKPSTRTPGARSREYRAGNDAAGWRRGAGCTKNFVSQAGRICARRSCCRCPWARPSPPDKTRATPGSSPFSCLWPRSLYCIVSVLSQAAVHRGCCDGVRDVRSSDAWWQAGGHEVMSHIYEDDEQTKFKFVGEIGLRRLISVCTNELVSWFRIWMLGKF